MILVDTSIWIDHLHRADEALVEALRRDEVSTHDLVLEELALGSVRDRTTVLTSLERLHRFPRLTHAEIRVLVEGHQLWGRGLSAVDVHLLGSVRLRPGAVLWTRDKRLAAACRDLGHPTRS